MVPAHWRNASWQGGHSMSAEENMALARRFLAARGKGTSKNTPSEALWKFGPPTGALQAGNKRPRGAIFGHCAPSVTTVEKPSGDFPDSFSLTSVSKGIKKDSSPSEHQPHDGTMSR